MSNAAQGNAINVVVRLPPDWIDEIDKLVGESNGDRVKPPDNTRSSLIRRWIERGLKDSRRTR